MLLSQPKCLSRLTTQQFQGIRVMGNRDRHQAIIAGMSLRESEHFSTDKNFSNPNQNSRECFRNQNANSYIYEKSKDLAKIMLKEKTKWGASQNLISKFTVKLQQARHCNIDEKMNMETNGTEQSPEIDSHTYGQLFFFYKVSRHFSG